MHQGPDLTPSAAWGSYEGSLASPDIGWVYIPDMRTSPEVDQLSRTVLYDRVGHLYRNEGLPRRIINGITRLVVGSGMIPEPMTTDAKYNARVSQLWAQRAESPKTFSLSEKFSCAGAQRMLKRTQLRLGDAALVPARDDEGRLRFALYGGNQIGNGVSPPKNMRDGVLVSQHDAALSYRILGRNEKGPTQVDVPARDVLLLVRREGPDWHRGVTCLAHAVKKLRSRSEVNDALEKGIKMSSYQAWAIEQQLGSTNVPKGLGPNANRPQVIVEDPRTKKPMVLEKFLGNGQIEELKPGQSLKILHDQRPHPNVQAFREEQVRDMVAGTDWPFEILWKIEALGGANTRFVLVDAQGKAEEEQEEMVEQILAPCYIMQLQEWERTGDLEPCTDPEWWLHEWVLPPRLSVDFGRDGRVYIEQWVRGHITLKNIFGSQGWRWKRETTQWLEEIAWKKTEMERLKLSPADLPTAAGASVAAADPETEKKQGKNGPPRPPPENDDDDEE